MNLTSRAALRSDVMQAEGFRQFPYFDCCGKPYRSCTCARKGTLTIGYGRNLDDVGISKLEGEVLLDHDLYTAETQATRAFDWFAALSDLRQRAIVELVFNMGLATFRGFRQTILAIKVKQFTAAAANLLDSRWKAQVGEGRSSRIARYLKDGG
jgi:lysozyme